MKHLLSFIVSVVLVTAACVREDDQGKATTVFRKGAVYTVDKNRPWAEAVAVRGNAIVYVGSDHGVQSYIGAETKVVDLAGKMLMPGFHDVHMHPISGSVFVYECNLHGLYTKEELMARLKQCAAQDRDSDAKESLLLVRDAICIYSAENDGALPGADGSEETFRRDLLKHLDLRLVRQAIHLRPCGRLGQ